MVGDFIRIGLRRQQNLDSDRDDLGLGLGHELRSGVLAFFNKKFLYGVGGRQNLKFATHCWSVKRGRSVKALPTPLMLTVRGGSIKPLPTD
jgi:hypothetical protein